MSFEELKKQREAEKAARDAKLKEKASPNAIQITKTLNATAPKTLSISATSKQACLVDFGYHSSELSTPLSGHSRSHAQACSDTFGIPGPRCDIDSFLDISVCCSELHRLCARHLDQQH